MDRMISDVFGSRDETLPRLSGGRGNPALDIWEENDDFFVAAELPGVDEREMDITALGRELTLDGKWAAGAAVVEEPSGEEDAADAESSECKEITHFHRERRTGSFHRVIRFPFDIDVQHVEAKVANGVLTVRVPKSPNAKPRRVELSSD